MQRDLENTTLDTYSTTVRGFLNFLYILLLISLHCFTQKMNNFCLINLWFLPSLYLSIKLLFIYGWTPKFYVWASTMVSIILADAMLKLGGTELMPLVSLQIFFSLFRILFLFFVYMIQSNCISGQNN